MRSLLCLSIQINSKKEQMVKIPLSKFSKLKCSFGAWRFSSGKPNPIKTTGEFRVWLKSDTIGMEPPSLL
jgi:hypothetical protein